MIKKTDMVKEAVKAGEWKKALNIAKDFRIGISKEQREVMVRAYECMVHPNFYKQIGVDIPKAIEEGVGMVRNLYEA